MRIQRHLRNQLGDAVDLPVRHAQHAPAVAQYGFRGHRAVGDDLADLVAAVHVRDVFDHAVAALHAEVDVEVRHRYAFGVEEAFEQQSETQRIQVGDAEAPRDQRARARAAARADRDVVALGPADEVRDDQEVTGEAHAHDGFEFRVQAAFVGLRREAGREAVFFQPFLQPVARAFADPRFERVLRGHREGRQVILAELKFQIATLGEFDAVLQRLGQVREQFRHRVRGLQPLLRRILAQAARIGQLLALLDAYARFVRLEIVGVQKTHVVAGDHRQPQRGGELQRVRVEGFLAFAAGARDLEVQPLVENAAQLFQRRARVFIAARAQQVSRFRFRGRPARSGLCARIPASAVRSARGRRAGLRAMRARPAASG